MSDQFGHHSGRPEFAAPEVRGPALPTPHSPPAPAQPLHDEPVRPRLTTKTGVALVAGLVAILLVSAAVTVWASSASPKAAMPAAWTAEPSAATTVPQHATAPVATGNRATSSTASTTARTTSSATANTTSATKPASTTRTTSSNLPSCGRTVSGSTFSVTLPQGWECMGGPSEPDVLVLIYNSEWDIIQVTTIGSKDPATACGADLARQVTRLVPQPDTVWGGKAARTAKVEVGGLTSQARCVESKGIVYIMFGAAHEGTFESVVAAMSTVGSAWTWK